MRELKLAAVCVFTASLCFFSSTAFAYKTYSNGYISKTIPIEDRTSYTEFRNHAINAWNNCGAGVNLYTVPGTGSNWIIDEQVADTFYGQYEVKTYQYGFFGKSTKFRIVLNRNTLVGMSSNVKKSVIVHELGHALSLDDNPDVAASIMRYDRDREKIVTPQEDDIKGVKAQ